MYKYIISYDLNTPGKDYSSLIKKIKAYSYAKINESVWIIRSSNNSSQIRDDLLNEIDKNDNLFVAKLTGEAAWYNCLSTSETIKKILN